MNKKILWIVLAVAVVGAVWYFGFRPTDPEGGDYQGKSPDECSRLQILCIAGYERFDDANGCGCRPISE